MESIQGDAVFTSSIWCMLTTLISLYLYHSRGASDSHLMLLLESLKTTLCYTQPFLKPIMKSASAGLMSASSEVIDTHDQYEASAS